MTTPPKDRQFMAKFKPLCWWSLAEWHEPSGRWRVVGHNLGRYFEESDLIDWHEVEARGRTGIERPKEQEQVSFKTLNKIVID